MSSSPSRPPQRHIAVVVPLKRFETAKARLAPAVDDAARARLARQMAERVIRCAAPHRVFVATDDDGVARWAAERSAVPVDTAGLGLDASVEAGRAAALGAGADYVVVAHGDLPLVRGFGAVTDRLAEGTLVMVADRRGEGTNVIGLPAAQAFAFRYGPGSADRHRTEAAARGLRVVEVDDETLAWDLDGPEDLPPGMDTGT